MVSNKKNEGTLSHLKRWSLGKVTKKIKYPLLTVKNIVPELIPFKKGEK